MTKIKRKNNSVTPPTTSLVIDFSESTFQEIDLSENQLFEKSDFRRIDVSENQLFEKSLKV